METEEIKDTGGEVENLKANPWVEVRSKKKEKSEKAAVHKSKAPLFGFVDFDTVDLPPVTTVETIIKGMMERKKNDNVRDPRVKFYYSQDLITPSESSVVSRLKHRGRYLSNFFTLEKCRTRSLICRRCKLKASFCAKCRQDVDFDCKGCRKLNFNLCPEHLGLVNGCADCRCVSAAPKPKKEALLELYMLIDILVVEAKAKSKSISKPHVMIFSKDPFFLDKVAGGLQKRGIVHVDTACLSFMGAKRNLRKDLEKSK